LSLEWTFNSPVYLKFFGVHITSKDTCSIRRINLLLKNSLFAGVVVLVVM